MQRFWLLAAPAAALLFSVACSPPAPTDGSSPDDSELAAEVGGVPITVHQLDEWIKEDLFRDKMSSAHARYELRQDALNRLIEERSLEIAAEKRGVSVESLVAEKVESLGPVSDSEVTAFWEEHKARLAGAKKEETLPQIRKFLASQHEAQARAELKEGVDVEIFLKPPRVQVAANGPSQGPETAPVTIVEFSDFQCPYCRRVLPALEQIRERYPEQVRIVYRNFPLSGHTRARPAAEASLCADEQGQFWPYHDKLFENSRTLGDEDLKRYAGEVGLDVAAFEQCYGEKRFAAQVESDIQAGRAAGVSGTPAFFVNGVMISGAKPAETFYEAIDSELVRLSEGT